MQPTPETLELIKTLVALVVLVALVMLLVLWVDRRTAQLDEEASDEDRALDREARATLSDTHWL